MRSLKDSEKELAQIYLEHAGVQAQRATCQRARCGSIIVLGSEIIGMGYNSPPGRLESQRRCSCEKEKYNPRITDKTCCIHAEQRAVIDALRRGHQNLKGSTLYFERANTQGERTFSGKPYCTLCSKFALDVGIEKWVLRHLEEEGGIMEYLAEEYNTLSFQYQND